MRTPALLQREGQLERRLPAELHQARHLSARGPLGLDDRHDVFECQRLEVEPIGRVVVGRHGLRIAVDHDRLEPLIAERECGMTAAVVELDALPNPVRAAAENDHLRPGVRVRLAGRLVRAVQIGRKRLELGRARVHALVDRLDVLADPPLANRRLGRLHSERELRVAEPGALQASQRVARSDPRRLLLPLTGASPQSRRTAGETRDRSS